MTTEKNTIRIQGTFKEIDINKEDFVSRWTSVAVQLGDILITDNADDRDLYKKVLERTETIASARFDKELEKQNK